MNSDYDKNKRTGIFGGTFDPVHQGHINIAHKLVQLELVEQVIFVPALCPPHKSENEISAAEHRLAMLSIALNGRPNLFISDFELKRQTVSCTIDTAAYFTKIFSDEMRIVIGADSLSELHTWHNADELVTNHQFIIYCRPEHNICKKTMLCPYFGKASVEKLLAGIVYDEEFTISSREIRDLIRRRENAEGMLPEEVLDYILANHLYV